MKFFCGFILLLWTSPLSAEPQPFLSTYEKKIRNLLTKADRQPADDREREAFWKGVVSGTQDPDLIYPATQALNVVLRSLGKDLEGHENCRKVPPQADDYEAQAQCLSFELGLSEKDRLDRLEQLFQQASEHAPGTIVPAMVISRHAVPLIFVQDIPRAVRLIRKGLATLPENARDMQAHLKKTIAIILMAPSNSQELVLEGLKLFQEAEAYFISVGDWERAENAAYNKGIAQIFSFKDYAGALRELERVQKDQKLLPLAHVFRAFALARLGQQEAADATLDQVDVDQPFLLCYMHLTRTMNQAQASMEPCLHLPQSTQSDVLLHITDELLQKKLKPEEEVLALRQFYWVYQNKLLAGMRAVLTHSLETPVQALPPVSADWKNYALIFLCALVVLLTVKMFSQ